METKYGTDEEGVVRCDDEIENFNAASHIDFLEKFLHVLAMNSIIGVSTWMR